MTLNDVVPNIDKLNEEGTIYAKKLDGKFLSSSEVIVLELSDDERDLKSQEIAAKHCPGFDYFLEVYMIKDMIRETANMIGYKSSSQQLDRIIHFAEYDA